MFKKTTNYLKKTAKSVLSSGRLKTLALMLLVGGGIAMAQNSAGDYTAGTTALTTVTEEIAKYVCLFLNKVDTLKSTIMKKKEEQLQISLDRVKLQKHVYELCRVQKLTINEVRKKTGLGMGTIYRYLHTFEEENPKLVEQMKKQGPNIIPEDYKKLQEEVLRLKCELKRERLRADFYEEMVAFGKEVYGIDLKKAGTK